MSAKEKEAMSSMNISLSNKELLNNIRGIKNLSSLNNALTFVLSHFNIKSDVVVKDNRKLVNWKE